MAPKLPAKEILKLSAISLLREAECSDEADLLARCRLDIADRAHPGRGSQEYGLTLTLRCSAADLGRFTDHESGWEAPSEARARIEWAIEQVLPAGFEIRNLQARAILVDRTEFEKSELERLLDAQKDLMIAVATGGPRIQSVNAEYKDREREIAQKLADMGRQNPNPFPDLWAWYGRWSSGDLPNYQSRRDYIRRLYEPLMESLAGLPNPGAASRPEEPTGWTRVDRAVDKIVAQVAQASDEEGFQGIGLLCRECLISVAQAVFDRTLHLQDGEAAPSSTDAARMLEAYFGTVFAGKEHEALRRHAKAALSLANHLQHQRTAEYRTAALCAEATRSIVNIVAIIAERRATPEGSG